MKRAPLRRLPFRRAFRIATILLTALPILAAARGADASGDVEVRRGGSSWARIDEDGSIRVEGRLAGTIEKDGSVRVHGRLEGRVEEGGTIRENGRMVGSVVEDGTSRAEGALLGRIEKDGAIRRHGALWGSASPCCAGFHDLRRVAALLFFFDRGFFGP